MSTARESFISWVVFSEKDQRRATEFLKSYEETETVDELGFGDVRDFYADLFYPGTTTVMTRGRYFTFLVALFLEMEREKVPSSEFKKVLKKKQHELREILAENERGIGVIGRDSKEELHRLPVSIYWNGIGVIKIFRQNGWPLASYIRNLDEYYRRIHGGVKDDDGNIHNDRPTPAHWEADDDVHEFVRAMFPKPLEWDRSLTLTLRPSESSYLCKRYQQVHPDSLIAWLLQKKALPQKHFPWDLGGAAKHAQDLHDAKMFSVLSKSAVLAYFSLLIRAKKDDEEQSRGVVKAWFGCKEVEALRGWDVNDWIARAKSRKVPITRGDEEFFSGWYRFVCGAKKAEHLLDGNDPITLIQRREVAKKGRRARLTNQSYLARWGSPDFRQGQFVNPRYLPFHLEYRATIGNRIVADILSVSPNADARR